MNKPTLLVDLPIFIFLSLSLSLPLSLSVSLSLFLSLSLSVCLSVCLSLSLNIYIYIYIYIEEYIFGQVIIKTSFIKDDGTLFIISNCNFSNIIFFLCRDPGGLREIIPHLHKRFWLGSRRKKINKKRKITIKSNKQCSIVLIKFGLRIYIYIYIYILYIYIYIYIYICIYIYNQNLRLFDRELLKITKLYNFFLKCLVLFCEEFFHEYIL